MRRLKRRLIERSRAAREGRRVYAFYRGFRDRRAGRTANPYKPGSEEARCWDAGWQYADSEQRESSPPPVCRFGPGGDYVRDWPEEQE